MRELLPDADKRAAGCFSTGDSYWWGGSYCVPRWCKVDNVRGTHRVAPRGLEGPQDGPEGGGALFCASFPSSKAISDTSLASAAQRGSKRSSPNVCPPSTRSLLHIFTCLAFSELLLNRKCLSVPKHSRWLVEYNGLKGFILCPKTTRLDCLFRSKIFFFFFFLIMALSHNSSFCCVKHSISLPSMRITVKKKKNQLSPNTHARSHTRHHEQHIYNVNSS